MSKEGACSEDNSAWTLALTLAVSLWEACEADLESFFVEGRSDKYLHQAENQ